VKTTANWLRAGVALIVIAGTAAIHATGDDANSPSFVRYVTTYRLPAYPVEARLRHLVGTGSVLMKINPQTGAVTSVTITESTGHAILDEAVLKTYRLWSFVPHTISEARVPIVFRRYDRGGNMTLTGAAALAINSPRPEYPLFARERHWTGAGVALLDIDERTGNVTAARMAATTGHQMLDDAALKAFRRWRFKAGTIKHVKIPIRYTMGGAGY
jgi:TonB family protein